MSLANSFETVRYSQFVWHISNRCAMHSETRSARTNRLASLFLFRSTTALLSGREEQQFLV